MITETPCFISQITSLEERQYFKGYGCRDVKICTSKAKRFYHSAFGTPILNEHNFVHERDFYSKSKCVKKLIVTEKSLQD
jgi:hypothetical protein